MAGPLTASPMQGVVVAITDAVLHGDSTHRGPAQLAAAARRAIERAFLASAPGLLRPCLLATAEIESDGGGGPAISLGGVYAELERRGARILATAPTDDGESTADAMLAFQAQAPS